MKVRALVERGSADEVGVALVDMGGEYIVGYVTCADIDDAKRTAEQASGEPLTWRSPPRDWGPDALLVSNYYEDEGWGES